MINIYNEKSLHNDLKQYLYETGDELECPYEGFIIDIKRKDLLIEIQTKHLNALRKKLVKLLDKNRIRIVHPILKKKEIVLLSNENKIMRKRFSPLHGNVLNIFEELIYIHDLFLHMNLEIQLLIVDAREIRIDNGKGSWRRKGISLDNIQLTKVHETILLKDGVQLFKYLPESIANTEFTTKSISLQMKVPLKRAQKICYCLKKMRLIKELPKKGNLKVYRKV